MNDFSRLYGEEYFSDRFEGKDEKREMSYRQEIAQIQSFVSAGNVLDVGCGMGNFLTMFGPEWDKYGIEISQFAADQAEEKGIKIINYGDKDAYFDLVVLRGVIQHLDTPLFSLKQCMEMLKPGGYLVFLATPNTNSPYYRFFHTLPMLDPERNFLLPSDMMLTQILKNFGMKIEAVRFPYLTSPYAQPFRDHVKFFLKLIGINYRFAFWKSMMEIYARKPLKGEG